MAEAKKEQTVITEASTGTNSSFSVGGFTSTTTSPQIDRTIVGQVLKDREQELRRIEAAVFSHIKALRALGKASVNTAEIADALSLSVADVERVIAALEHKGVRRTG